MSQSTQCLGSVLPLAMLFARVKMKGEEWKLTSGESPHSRGQQQQQQQQQQQDKRRGMKVHHIAEDGCKGHQADD